MNFSAEPDPSEQTILMVDDMPANLGVLAQALESHGFNVAVAQDGEEALLRARFVRPDLILLDVMMPGIDGFETCRRLKAIESLREIPVIFMTALSDSDDKVNGFQAGGVDYIAKPFQIEEVLARVKTHLALRSMQTRLAQQNLEMRKEIELRQKVEISLKESYEQLETRVAQRTTELAETNAQLKREIERHTQTAQALQKKEARLRRLVEANIIGIDFWNINGSITEANDAFLQICGYSRQDLAEGKLQRAMLTPPEYHLLDQNATAELRRVGKFIPYEKEYIRKDGSRIPVLVGGALIDDSQEAGVAFVLDLSELKKAEKAVRDKEARIRSLFESDLIGIALGNPDQGPADVNDAFLKITGYTREDFLGGKIGREILTPPAHHAPDEPDTGEAGNKRGSTFEKEYLRKDGTRVPILVGTTRFGDDGNECIAFVLDLTERKQAEERIRYLADHDALTGLPNRTLLQDRVEQAIALAHRNRTRIAVLFIDLDYFKHINDSLGHQVGDALLQMVAARLQNCVREGDTVARLGGDEFILSLPLADGCSHAVLVAEKALHALDLPFILDGHELHVSGSIGISLYPDDGTDVDTLMRNADAAMYAAKEKGRGNYQFFTPSLNQAAHHRLSMTNSLRHAMTHNEFALYYQPQIDMERGTILSAEALLRWRQPGKAPISCSEFIPIAEETGLILPIGEWVLREACRQLERWHSLGYRDLLMAINLSPRQFYQPDFQGTIKKIIDQSGISAASLDLEITENILMRRSEDNVTTLRGLSDMGVKLSIDDFGTGYSSLAYLQRFPVDALKIDRSFVHGIGQNLNDTALVRAIISMAHSLRLKVLAEGVETLEQIDFLVSQGCRAAQGYYYSEAVSADAFTDMLRKQHAHALGA